MNVLSLFDGISCGQVALQRAGIKVDIYYASEVDRFAKQVTHKNWPDTMHLGDACRVKASNLMPISLLLGGSPCKGFSNSGKKLGLQDDRSKLFFEYLRIHRELQILAQEANRPYYFLLENVKMCQEDIDTLSAYMRCLPIEIDSALVSGQRRKRLYWTNIPVIGRPKDLGIKCSDVLEFGYTHYDKAPTLTTRNFAWYQSNRDSDMGVHCYTEDWQRRYFTPIECERLQTLPDDYTRIYGKNDDWPKRYAALGNCWTVDVIAWILSFISGCDNQTGKL
jgi:site-specific DNA-cytosine methylase